jgi:hypothetical protein
MSPPPSPQIFLSLRILEFRDRGFSDVESVKLGFCLSAATITTAGVIMMISFGFLLVASQEILGQWGFYIGTCTGASLGGEV